MFPDLALYIVDGDEADRIFMRTIGESTGLPTLYYSSAENFLSAYHRDLTGCLVCDLLLPGISGIELLERLVAARSSLAVILVGAKVEIAQCVRAMKLGAIDVLEKPFHRDLLRNAIQRALLVGEQRLIRANHVNQVEDDLRQLSAREHQVLRQLLDGNSHQSIAEELNLRIEAVEAHLASLLKKTRAETLIDVGRMLLDIESWKNSP